MQLRADARPWDDRRRGRRPRGGVPRDLYGDERAAAAAGDAARRPDRVPERRGGPPLHRLQPRHARAAVGAVEEAGPQSGSEGSMMRSAVAIAASAKGKSTSSQTWIGPSCTAALAR